MFPQRRAAHEYDQYDPNKFAVSIDDYSRTHRILLQQGLQIYARISTKGDNPDTQARFEVLSAHAKTSANTVIPNTDTTAQDEQAGDDTANVPVSTNRRRTSDSEEARKLTSTPTVYDPPNMNKR